MLVQSPVTQTDQSERSHVVFLRLLQSTRSRPCRVEATGIVMVAERGEGMEAARARTPAVVMGKPMEVEMAMLMEVVTARQMVEVMGRQMAVATGMAAAASVVVMSAVS